MSDYDHSDRPWESGKTEKKSDNLKRERMWSVPSKHYHCDVLFSSLLSTIWSQWNKLIKFQHN